MSRSDSFIRDRSLYLVVGVLPCDLYANRSNAMHSMAAQTISLVQLGVHHQLSQMTRTNLLMVTSTVAG
jgi:hypothetical protein